MDREQEQSARRRIVRTVRAAACVFLLVTAARCSRGTGHSTSSAVQSTLRIGVSVGQASATNAQNGLRQVVPLLTNEGLLRIGDDGRPAAWLAESWRVASDNLSITAKLRPGVKFQDGTAVTPAAIVDILAGVLPRFMGPAASDIEAITATPDGQVKIALRQPSAFALEALEAQIQKPGTGVSTGPFVVDGPKAPTEMHANLDYYLGPPSIGHISFSTYPSVRAAWAEMLRNHLDMLWDVGVDALDSLQGATNITVFPYTRHYQYVVIFNTRGAKFRPKEIRRALSEAIDRASLVQQALDSHGVPSSGPVWPQHWAISPSSPKFAFDPGAAVATLAKAGAAHLKFTCLIPPDYERIALVVKRQLEAVDVEMEVNELPPDRIYDAMSKGDFDAVLFDAISGPSLFRPYLWWHSGAANPAGFSSSLVDAALDRVRHARSDDEYRAGVEAFQQAMMDDPPAIFLAWGQRARAVSSRFKIPAEPGRDVLATVRLWQPQADTRARN